MTDKKIKIGAHTVKPSTLRNIFHRLGQKANPWQDMLDHARPLKG